MYFSVLSLCFFCTFEASLTLKDYVKHRNLRSKKDKVSYVIIMDNVLKAVNLGDL